jgi:hypothetical protein
MKLPSNLPSLVVLSVAKNPDFRSLNSTKAGFFAQNKLGLRMTDAEGFGINK